jgi:hypothetical protein
LVDIPVIPKEFQARSLVAWLGSHSGITDFADCQMVAARSPA